MSVVDDFLSDLPPEVADAFARLRTLAVEEVPSAAEDRRYGLPALTYRDKGLLGFRVARGHLSVFPFSSEPVAALGDRLAGFDVSKGTIRFDVGHPVPDDLVRDLVRRRRDEIDASLARR